MNNNTPNNGVDDNTINTPSQAVSATMGIGMDFVKLIMRMIFVKTMTFINYFLETLKDELASIVPNQNDLNNVQNNNATLLNAIEAISQSPEFQQKWTEFSETIAQLMKVLVQKVANVTQNEVNDIVTRLVDMAEKNTKASVYGVGMGVLDGVCAIPPIVPFCAMATVASTASKVGSNTLITMIETSSKMVMILAKVLGENAQPIMDTIDRINEFMEYLRNARDSINAGITNVANTVSSVANTASDAVSNATNNMNIATQKGGVYHFLKSSNKSTMKNKNKNKNKVKNTNKTIRKRN